MTERKALMNRTFALYICAVFVFTNVAFSGEEEFLFGEPGFFVEYRIDADGTIPDSNVKTFDLTLGSQEFLQEQVYQWIQFHAVKENGVQFSVWILANKYPSKNWKEAENAIARYLVQEDWKQAVEYRHKYTKKAVLPELGAWEYLFPQPKDKNAPELFSVRTNYLGHSYTKINQNHKNSVSVPKHVIVLNLLPDARIGVPHNSKQIGGERRYDDSDYEYARMKQSDYDEAIDAGMNCFRVDKEQVEWIELRDVLYWGIGGQEILYPEYLYRSNYLGPLLFIDEPGVCTRDHVIRPRLKSDPSFRKSITPQICFEEFVKYFDEAKNKKNPTVLMRALSDRKDVDVGDMNFQQQNLYSWETIVSTALHQLSVDRNGPPSGIVFEPPGRIGTKRVLPEMNMVYQCQIPTESPKNFTDIIYGFIRGAARSTDKTWGTSVYGSVARDDAPWYLTHAFDHGAQWFMFWDSHRLACVPHDECLALSRNLHNHIENHPIRNLEKLKQAAEIAILLPKGYNLGHVHMGKGNLWGVGELNLERTNSKGVKYRTVMGNFFTEIERCIRLGVSFDLFWDLPTFQSEGYREIIRIREDGKVDIERNGKSQILGGPRIPARPDGEPPKLSVDLSHSNGNAPLEIDALADIEEGSSIVYYTSGTNKKGIYVNAKVLWELYGPSEEDYRVLSHEFRDVDVEENGYHSTVKIQFSIEKAGLYRLRASTCDLAGRTSVVWKTIEVSSRL